MKIIINHENQNNVVFPIANYYLISIIITILGYLLNQCNGCVVEQVDRCTTAFDVQMSK